MGDFRIPVSYERGAPVNGGRVGSKVAITGGSGFLSSDFASLYRGTQLIRNTHTPRITTVP